ncbi:MAG: agmatinase family protein [Pseudomonadota bacterium]
MANRSTLSDANLQLESGHHPLADAGFLGSTLDPEQAALVLLPVPWEATTSYGGGTSKAPEAIRRASHQLDLEDGAFDRPYRAGIALLEPDPQLHQLNTEAKTAAQKAIEALERGETDTEATAQVNRASQQVNLSVYQSAMQQLEAGKFVGLVGGDHSSPEGLIRALAKRQEEPFAILHFDAHHDLRQAYEGFINSHASIFRNIMQDSRIDRLVQVGIRDYSREEKQYAQQLEGRCSVFYDHDLFEMRARGESFRHITEKILAELPRQLYISFDIDALDPAYCPSTGTPVPGGLSYQEACYIIEQLAQSGRRIVGFDLCEVSPGETQSEWDANVGARLLYKLSGALLHSQGLG